MQGVSAAQADTDQRFAEVTTTAFPAEPGSSSASVGAAMSGAVIIAQLIGHEYETFGDDERLAREHVEYFYEEYLEDAGYPQ